MRLPIRPFRIVPPVVVHAKGSAARYCSVCSRPSNNGKPWCSEHIAQSPMVARLIREVEANEREASSAAVDLEGLAAREVIRELAQSGKLTIRRLAVEVGITFDHAKRVAQALELAGRARISLAQRGTRTVELA